jgi:hypothetical protein
MTKMVEYDDSPIVDEKALAEKHIKLVDKLKESLYAGQAGFIKSGQYLSEIKAGNTYLSEDSSREVEWDEFLSRPDLPLGGFTPGSRRRIAYKLISVWETVASQKDVDKKLLAEIGYSKLALVASAINNPERDPKIKLNDWLDKAKELTHEDLAREVGDKGQSLADLHDCKHKDVEKVDSWRCKNCKTFLRENPNAKSKK